MFLRLSQFSSVTRGYCLGTSPGPPKIARILSQEKCFGMASMLAAPRGVANLLQEMAEAKRVARCAAIARAAVDICEFAYGWCKRRRLHAGREFEGRFRGASRETVALQQAQKFAIQPRGQQRICLPRFRRVQ